MTAAASPDHYCLGSCMTYCGECKWLARWVQVGAFSRDQRAVLFPDLVRVSETKCQLTNGTLFVAKELNA